MNVILEGSTRLSAGRRLGIDTSPVVKQDSARVVEDERDQTPMLPDPCSVQNVEPSIKNAISYP